MRCTSSVYARRSWTRTSSRPRLAGLAEQRDVERREVVGEDRDDVDLHRSARRGGSAACVGRRGRAGPPGGSTTTRPPARSTVGHHRRDEGDQDLAAVARGARRAASPCGRCTTSVHGRRAGVAVGELGAQPDELVVAGTRRGRRRGGSVAASTASSVPRSVSAALRSGTPAKAHQQPTVLVARRRSTVERAALRRVGEQRRARRRTARSGSSVRTSTVTSPRTPCGLPMRPRPAARTRRRSSRRGLGTLAGPRRARWPAPSTARTTASDLVGVDDVDPHAATADRGHDGAQRLGGAAAAADHLAEVLGVRPAPRGCGHAGRSPGRPWTSSGLSTMPLTRCSRAASSTTRPRGRRRLGRGSLGAEPRRGSLGVGSLGAASAAGASAAAAASAFGSTSSAFGVVAGFSAACQPRRRPGRGLEGGLLVGLAAGDQHGRRGRLALELLPVAGDLEDALDRLGRLRADTQPVGGAVGVDLDEGGVLLRVVLADRLDRRGRRAWCARRRRRCGSTGARILPRRISLILTATVSRCSGRVMGVGVRDRAWGCTPAAPDGRWGRVEGRRQRWLAAQSARRRRRASAQRRELCVPRTSGGPSGRMRACSPRSGPGPPTGRCAASSPARPAAARGGCRRDPARPARSPRATRRRARRRPPRLLRLTPKELPDTLPAGASFTGELTWQQRRAAAPRTGARAEDRAAAGGRSW